MKPAVSLLIVIISCTIFSVHSQTSTTITYDTIGPNNKTPLRPLVSAINMNVLYLGLDNPVNITVPGKYDKIIVECLDGKITGDNGKYIIRPVAKKQVTLSLITVLNDKIIDTTTFYFRVKLVPTPEITWCNKKSGESVDRTCIGGYIYQNTCGGTGGSSLIPRMEDFDFDVYATIQSFDMAYTLDGKLIEKKEYKGNHIPKDIATEVKNLPIGTQVFFTNVRIICPGGDTRISSATFTVE